MKICNMCIKNSSTPEIEFDDRGVCNYCTKLAMMDKLYPVSKSELKDMFDEVKKIQKDTEYDCVIGISGGCDSMYLLDQLVKHGLRVKPVHWNNNWNTKTASENMKCVCEKLDLDIDYYGGQNVKDEYDDICKSFLLADVIDMDIPNDIALTRVLYESAEKYGVHYIMNGHSFRTEGFTPSGWTWMDGRYIQDVHEKFGSVQMKGFPNLWIELFDKYLDFGIKRFRPLYYMDYNKQAAKEYLNKEYGWEWYGGHHSENRYTKFIGSYMYPKRFGVDLRYVEFSALVYFGQMTREEALKKVCLPPISTDEAAGLISEVKKRLSLSDEQFERILISKGKSYRDYKNYIPEFKKRLPIYRKAVSDGMLPYTFVFRVENEPIVEVETVCSN